MLLFLSVGKRHTSDWNLPVYLRATVDRLSMTGENQYRYTPYLSTSIHSFSSLILKFCASSRSAVHYLVAGWSSLSNDW